MLSKTRAVVLSSLRYQDSSLIVRLFTRALGIQSVLVQSVGKSKSSFKASYFLPLNELEIVAYFSQKGLSRLKEASVIQVPYNTQSDVLKMAVAGFMVEVVQKCLHEGDPQAELYDFLVQESTNLDEAEQMGVLPLQFLFKLSGHLGFQPGSLDELTENQAMDHNSNLHPAFSQLVDGESQAHWSRQERSQLMTLFLTFYQWHVEGFKSLHTIEVLKEVLH